MSYFKRFLLLGSIAVFLLAGLLLTFHTKMPSTAFASGCNTVATGSWSNNCTVSPGNISNFVYAIQDSIDESNAPCGANIDGDFGPQTFTAVECFQSNRHLSVDGIVGSQTWGTLYATLKFDHSSNGWKYYHGQIQSTDNYRQWASSGVWYIFAHITNHWCQINLSSPC